MSAAVRPATEADLEELLALERSTATAPHWSYATYAAMLEHHASAQRRCLLVAGERPALAGFAVGRVLEAGREIEAELESVTVREADRRRGVGSALCRAVMRWARSQGAQAILLEARAGSTGALRLYTGLGFVTTGRRPGYYRDPLEDAVLMRCNLAGREESATAGLFDEAPGGVRERSPGDV